jgi:hypothetical protein
VSRSRHEAPVEVAETTVHGGRARRVARLQEELRRLPLVAALLAECLKGVCDDGE